MIWTTKAPRGNRWVRAAVLFLICLVPVGRISAASELNDKEQSLRKRVEELYKLMQAGKWAEAEDYVAPDSKQIFHTDEKKSFQGFRVESIDLDPGGESAEVVVAIYNYLPISPKLMAFAHHTEWGLINGLWCLELPKPDLSSFQKGGGPTGNQGAEASSPPEQLKFKGHRFGLGTVHAGETKTVRFPFTNVTDHTVTITSVELVSPCLKLKSEKKVYKPGESGELVIEFDPGTLEGEYGQTVIVKTDPGRLTTRLLIYGVVAFHIPQDSERSEGTVPPKSEPPPEKPHN